MQAVVLAAGQGSRLRPLTRDRPKSMVPVAGKPVIHHTLEGLAAAGVKEAVVVVGHGRDVLQRYLGDGDFVGMKLTYVVQEARLGPGHALHLAREHVHGDFLLVPADTWCSPAAWSDLVAAKGPTALLLESPRLARHGHPVSKRGRIVAIDPDAAGETVALAGAHRLDATVFDHLQEPWSMRAALNGMLAGGGTLDIINVDPSSCIDLVDVRDLLDLHSMLLDDIEEDTKAPDGATITGSVHLGTNTTVSPGAVIYGPAWIGNDCSIGAHVVIQPGTSIRNHVRIEPFTLLKRANLGSNIHVRSHTRLQDCIVDNGASIGAMVFVGAGSAIGADAIIRSRATILEDGRIGNDATVAMGRTVRDVPDGGEAV